MKLKAVIIGFSHMHVNEIALYISEHPDMELVAVADVPSHDAEPIPALRYTPAWNLKNVTDRYCRKLYIDYREMLEREKPDIAFILSENVQKPEIVEECAKRGVNVSIEKPIAVSYAEAKKIYASVMQYGIEAVVNWPVVWREYILRMKAALDEEIVGKPLKLRYINGHTGPLGKGAKHRGVADNAEKMTDEQRGKTWWYRRNCGGGAYLDIGCYGCFFSRWLMGQGAKSIVAMGANLNTPYGNTEDNFGALIRYENAISVIEGTWTTPRVAIPSGPMVVCTDGVILCTGGAENAPNVVAYDSYGREVPVPNISVPESFRNMPSMYAAHRNHGEKLHDMLTLDTNMEVMAILDALIRSAASGKEEFICE